MFINILAKFQRHSETSREAAIPSKAVQLADVYTFVKKRGDYGATGDEVAQALNIPIGTASARLCDLFDKDLIKKSDRRRITRSKRPAVVHTAR